MFALFPSAGFGSTQPTIMSDRADYTPGSTVTLTGANWVAGNSVHIVVNDTLGQTWQHVADVTAAGDGSIVDVFTLPNYFIAKFDVTATGSAGTVTTTFTDSSAVLSQCQNGGVGDPTEPCEGGKPPDGGNGPNGFQNYEPGNVNGGKGHWAEGEFIAYRTLLSGLAGGPHTLDIRYDTVSGGKHALDYLGSYDATETTGASTTFHYNHNNPCFDIDLNGGTCGTPAAPTDTSQIPTPTITNCGGSLGTGPALTQPGMGNIAGFGNGVDITAISYLVQNNPSGGGDCDTSMRISFTMPTSSVPAKGWNAVIAWGGHIASRIDWGNGHSASAITGSPFHMHLDLLDGQSTGSQDRQLATTAIFFQPTLVTHVHNSAHQDITNGTIPAGQPVHDSSVLSNTSQDLNGNPNAGGTVTYTLYNNGTCDSANIISTQTVSVTNSVVPESTPTSSLAVGSYSYRAVYSGDEPQGQNLSATAACEPFSVISSTPTVATQIHQEPDPSSGPITDVQGTNIPLGSTVHDSATVSGSSGTPTGSVTFTFYKSTTASRREPTRAAPRRPSPRSPSSSPRT